MNKLRGGPTLTLALIGSAALGATISPHSTLQVKRGLWMFSDTTKVSGDTVFPDTVKTLPGDRAQRLAGLRQMLSQPSRERECLSQASLEQKIFNQGNSCKQTIASNTPRLLVVLTECRAKIGSFAQDTTERIVISSPTSVTTSIHSVSTQSGKTMIADSVESGHMVSPDCGNVHTIEQLP